MQELIPLISNVGFPIFIAVYLVYQQQRTLDELRETIENNTLTMNKLLIKLGGD